MLYATQARVHSSWDLVRKMKEKISPHRFEKNADSRTERAIKLHKIIIFKINHLTLWLDSFLPGCWHIKTQEKNICHPWHEGDYTRWLVTITPPLKIVILKRRREEYIIHCKEWGKKKTFPIIYNSLSKRLNCGLLCTIEYIVDLPPCFLPFLLPKILSLIP